MIVVGVDIGSRSSKAVVLKNNQIAGTAILDTEARSNKTSEKVLADALENANCSQSEVDRIVATGYGRITAPFADKIITEITCHAKGAYHFWPQARTIIDIGGQDSKVIRLGEAGMVDDFVMNDRCAAGTGRFIEVMAKILKIDLPTFANCYFTADNPCRISSVCTVFAESEVISLLAEGKHSDDIAKGLMKSIAARVGTMVKRLGIAPEIAFSGGVAKNDGVRQALIDELEIEITPMTRFDPQLIGAMGAALLAQNH